MARAIRLDLTESEQNIAHLALDHAVLTHWPTHEDDEASCRQMASDARLGVLNVTPYELELLAGALAMVLWAKDTVIDTHDPEEATSLREDAEYLITKIVRTVASAIR